jgi:hypothetical protein
MFAVISDLGHAGDADVMFQASLVMLQEVLGDNENGIYVDVLAKTAECLRMQGRVVDAESALRQALLISKALYDQQKHVVVAESLTTLACILLEGKKALEAKALLEENILPIYEELCGRDSIAYVYCRGLQGLCMNSIKPMSGRQLVTDSIVQLVKDCRLGKEHAHLKMLRAGDNFAADDADRIIQVDFPEGENKFSIHSLTLPTDKEIKKTENVTENILSSSLSVTSDHTTTRSQKSGVVPAPSRDTKVTVTPESPENNNNSDLRSVSTLGSPDMGSSAQNRNNQNRGNQGGNNGVLEANARNPGRSQPHVQASQFSQSPDQHQLARNPPLPQTSVQSMNPTSLYSNSHSSAGAGGDGSGSMAATTTPTPNHTPLLSPRLGDSIPAPAASLKNAGIIPPSPIVSDPLSMLSQEKPVLRSVRNAPDTSNSNSSEDNVIQLHSTALPKLGRKGRAYNPSLAEQQDGVASAGGVKANPTQRFFAASMASQNVTTNVDMFDSLSKSSTLPPINSARGSQPEVDVRGNTNQFSQSWGGSASMNVGGSSFSFGGSSLVESILKSASADSMFLAQQPKNDVESDGESGISKSLADCPQPSVKVASTRPKMRTGMNMGAMKAAASNTGPSLAILQSSSQADTLLSQTISLDGMPSPAHEDHSDRTRLTTA